ncbi:hypothetical protein ATO12_05515 [Aquimarina atlantica]|uniref:Baseplate protein J-like domain-containing protein n=1 Tax=Aquimarina atlantica TaxID=1317122 RepID=A0A023BP61_9FLAO|nr:hypothetical protein [Aquimarina atlantica]EZH71837.1 hypothetical protein ATO12_05515 [Aquimarina atlantica]
MGFKKAIIQRDGTSQRQRLLQALDPSFVKIEERKTTDLLRIIRVFSQEIAYYNKKNQVDGNWQDFFPSDPFVQNLIELSDPESNLDPHLALLVTFLQLLELVRNDLNQLAQKHLEFYYKDVLRFTTKESIPDKVHILFGIAKNANDPYLLKRGSLLDAGKDENNNKLVYETDRDIVINKAKLSNIRTIYVDFDNDKRVYAALQANSVDGIGGALNPDEPSWNIFGESQFGKSNDKKTMIDGDLGFAIASPILLLKEGSRTITLEMTFQSFRLSDANFDFLSYGFPPSILNLLKPIQEQSFKNQDDFEKVAQSILGDEYEFYIEDLIAETKNPFRGMRSNQLKNGFIGYTSTLDSWFRNDPASVTITGQNQLTFIFQIEIQDPPLVFFPGNDESAGLLTKYPAIKVLFNPLSDTYLYELLGDLQVLSYDIEVEVSGVRNLVLQNEDGPLDAEQAFLPFGARPSLNSNFYIGNHEVFQKKLENLSLTLSWADLPTVNMGFVSYYAGYPAPYFISNRQADIRYLQNGKWISPPSPNDIELFNTSSNGTFIQSPFTINIPLLSIQERDPRLEEFDSFSNDRNGGFIRLSLLSPDFGHYIFQNIYAQQALDIASGDTGTLPNTPYTPKLKSVELNYATKESVTFGIENEGFEQFFYIEPFGSVLKKAETSTFCFPQLPNGSLFIGINELEPPQNLSVLFQVLEGSADPDIAISRRDVQWSYLINDEWVYLTDSEIQIDTTQGLQTSGIIDFSIPAKANKMHNVVPSGQHWLRAEILKDPAGISRAIDFHTQAMSATFVQEENGLQQFSKPLEPNVISKLISGIGAIKSVEQPYASFGGRPSERENNFLNRVSERLRHKQRAIGVWDYERIVLEGFPFIYKVKSLNHAQGFSEASPGNVTLIVIPDLQNKNAANPLQPKTSFILRASIKNYVTQYIPFFVSLFVENPKYEPILVDLKVGLKPGFDGSFYGQLLNEDLKRFLSPWAFEKGKDITFGGRIYKSSILAFLEEQTYVDYVTDFKLYHLNKSPGIGEMCVDIDFEIFEDGREEVIDFAEASTARSILVSAQKHDIVVLQPGELVCASAEIPSGIGTMILEYDFIVS